MYLALLGQKSTQRPRCFFNRRAYDPADYAHLNVSAEIKDLFQYIGRYKAHEVDLDTSLRCFVPDFIPAVGDMDAFLKVPRPDKNPDELGFKASRGVEFGLCPILAFVGMLMLVPPTTAVTYNCRLQQEKLQPM